MARFAKAVLLFALIYSLSVGYVFAGGLSSHFVEEKMDNLQPGKAYSVKEVTKRALSIENTTKDVTVDIEIATEKPVDYNLVPGYEPIPDLSWVKIEKNYFKDVGPGGSVETDMTITIPDNKEYYGKKYQVYIYSHTAGKGTFRLGIMGRILIHTAQK